MKFEAGSQLRYAAFKNSPIKQTKENRLKMYNLKIGKQVEFSSEDAKPLLAANLIQKVKENLKVKGA